MKKETYQDFLIRKNMISGSSGISINPQKINRQLYPFEKAITLWALRKGRAALFEDCGLGKTIQQLEWSFHIVQKENAPVLIIAPLAVAEQTKQEGQKFNISVNLCSSQSDVNKSGINITNYQKLHKFQSSAFVGVVLDESSILKNMAGATRNQIISMFQQTPYRLACTATPSPNDYMELGNHAEFLGIMKHSEMLSTFFVNDSGNVGNWRLKKHAEEYKFWEWLSSWAVMLSNPSDLGYQQNGFNLPSLKYIEHIIPAKTIKRGMLFPVEAQTMMERKKIRKETTQIRCEYIADIINKTNEQWVIWCGLNQESHLLTKLIDNAVEVAGFQDSEERAKNMLDFAKGKVHRLVTKPSIAGFGMNWQNCSKTAFVGLNDSWEQLYQATRRLWRFGQKRNVDVHIIIEEREGKILENIKRKDKQAKHMVQNMVQHTKHLTKQKLSNKEEKKREPLKQMELPEWA